VASHAASYKKPRTVRFVDELPRSATGKVLKRALRTDATVQQADTNGVP
jgi:acyl-coenzyme A synthetase/AMP-(fatty) acid ligase